MSSLPATLSTIQVDLLRSAPLKNEEIIELLSFICRAESIEPYREHLVVLQEKYDMTLEVRPLEIEILSLREKFDLRTLRNFYQGTGTHGYHSLIMPLITAYQEDRSAALYARMIEEIFGVVPDQEFIQQIVDFLRGSEMNGVGSVSLERYFTNKLNRISAYAPIPSYIRDFGDIELDRLFKLTQSEIDPDLPDDLIADYLLQQMGNYLVVEEEEEEPNRAKNVILDKLESMESQQKEEFLKLFQVDPEDVKRAQNDRDTFRVYGPCNPMPDTDFSQLTAEDGEPDVNVIFGGARMFTFQQFEYDYENDLPVDDWFRGYCLQCSKRIRAYFHAVRVPYIQGGFSGCYCSWDCVREFIKMDTEQGDPSLYNTYVIKVNLTRAIEEQMNRWGIADRSYENREETEGLDAPEINQDRVETIEREIPIFNPQEFEIPRIETDREY